MQITCSQCGKVGTVPDSYAGKTVKCKCGQGIRVEAEVIPLVEEAPPPPPSKRNDDRRAWLIVAISSAVAMPLFCCGGCLTMGLISPDGSSKNAKCPMCGEQFHLPQVHGRARFTREFDCPNCHVRLVAAQFGL